MSSRERPDPARSSCSTTSIGQLPPRRRDQSAGTSPPAAPAAGRSTSCPARSTSSSGCRPIAIPHDTPAAARSRRGPRRRRASAARARPSARAVAAALVAVGADAARREPRHAPHAAGRSSARCGPPERSAAAAGTVAAVAQTAGGRLRGRPRRRRQRRARAPSRSCTIRRRPTPTRYVRRPVDAGIARSRRLRPPGASSTPQRRPDRLARALRQVEVERVEELDGGARRVHGDVRRPSAARPSS